MSSKIFHYNTYPGLTILKSPINLPPNTDGALLAANGADHALRQPRNDQEPPSGTEGEQDTDVPEFMLPPPLLSEEEALTEFEAWKRAKGMPTVVLAWEGDSQAPQSQGRNRVVKIEELLNPVKNDRVKEMMSISTLLNADNTGSLLRVEG